MGLTSRSTRAADRAGFEIKGCWSPPGYLGRSCSIQGSGVLRRILPICCLVALVVGCGDPSANQIAKLPAKVDAPVKTIPPLLPISIGDVLQLPDIAIDEADGVGPGFRYWHLITRRGSMYVYAEAYDEPFLTKLTVTVEASQPGTFEDHLKVIHETVCRLRPDDPWLKESWPESGASGFSLPASTVHDGLVLDVSRDEKSTELTVTAIDPNHNKAE